MSANPKKPTAFEKMGVMELYRYYYYAMPKQAVFVKAMPAAKNGKSFAMPLAIAERLQSEGKVTL